MQSRHGAVECRNARLGQTQGDSVTAGAEDVEIRGVEDRLLGPPEHFLDGLGEALAKAAGGLEFREKDAECGVRIVHKGGEAVGEDALEVAAGVPGIQRVDRLQTGIKPGRELLARRAADLRERHPRILGKVDQHLAFAAGIEYDGEAARRRSTRLREHQQRGGQIVQRIDPNHPIAVEHRLIGRVVAGHRAGVAERQRGALLGAPDLEGDDRDVAHPGLLERGDKTVRIAHGLDKQADDAGRLHLQREIHVVGGRGRQLLAGGNDEVVGEPSVVMDQRGERRARMGDEGDGAWLQVLRRREAAYPQARLKVVVAHAIAAADWHAGLAGEAGQPLDERRVGVVLQITVGEDHRRARPVRDRLGKLGLEPMAGNRQHR